MSSNIINPNTLMSLREEEKQQVKLEVNIINRSYSI